MFQADYEYVHELTKRRIRDPKTEITKEETRLIKKVYREISGKSWKGCSSCWQKLYIETSPETITNKFQTMSQRKFHLQPGKQISIHGIPTVYTEANLTDDAALMILKKSAAHIKFFSSYPDDYAKRVANFNPGKKKEVQEEVLVGKAAKRANSEERKEKEVKEEEPEEVEPINYELMSKKELQGFASSKELPESEWENLSKPKLIAYLEAKVR